MIYRNLTLGLSFAYVLFLRGLTTRSTAAHLAPGFAPKKTSHWLRRLASSSAVTYTPALRCPFSLLSCLSLSLFFPRAASVSCVNRVQERLHAKIGQLYQDTSGWNERLEQTAQRVDERQGGGRPGPTLAFDWLVDSHT